ncbi:sialic acid-binding Ig-like lectin 13 [Macrotis lagotis]|uniref:sialic acid-binding Ig-like lectin 13 n=1 Tax=Macrotis lagotis TaxID=92651 RepID=UPI003D698E56
MLLPLFLLSLGGSLSQHSACDLHVPTSVTVQEGLYINILCNFSHPQTSLPFALGSWFKEEANIYKENPVVTNDLTREAQEKSRGRFHLIGIPWKNCSSCITDAQRGGSGKYFFRIVRGPDIKYNLITRPLQDPCPKGKKDHRDLTQVKLVKLGGSVEGLRTGGRGHLLVSFLLQPLALFLYSPPALTEKPVIYIPQTLEENQPVTVFWGAFWTCMEGTSPIFSWTGTAVSSQGCSQDFPYFSKLSLMPKLQDHGTNLTCQMTFPGANVSTEITVQLSVNSRTRPETPIFFNGFLLGSGIVAMLAFFPQSGMMSREATQELRQGLERETTAESGSGEWKESRVLSPNISLISSV